MTKNGGTNDRRRLVWRAATLCVGLQVALAGCGSSGLSPVSGKVTYKGAAVKGGNLTFSPVSKSAEGGGRAASAEIQADGTYKLATNSPGDGAVAGRHKVIFNPPARDGEWKNPKANPPPPPYMGLVPKEQEVEVKSGDNTINIELVPGFRK